MGAPQPTVAVAFGANLGEPIQTIRSAARMLQQQAIPDLRLAPFYSTTPVDCVPGTRPFINTVGIGSTTLLPEDLLRTCKAIESALGRPAEHERNAARTVDLDLILWGTCSFRLPGLTVPHPRMTERLFVIAPLADIAPNWQIPGSEKTAAELRAALLASTPGNWGRRLDLP